MDREKIELIKLAFQAVTLIHPTEEQLVLLSRCSLKRVLEILLIIQQSPRRVKNVTGFIYKCIKYNWTPSTVPEKIKRKTARNKSLQTITPDTITASTPSVPFYNWLDQY